MDDHYSPVSRGRYMIIQQNTNTFLYKCIVQYPVHKTQLDIF